VNDALNENAGHRSRLRNKFLNGCPSTIYDHELLEMLLAIAQPRKDTKPVAKKLIKLFSSFSGVIGAEIGQLKGVKGIGDSSVAMLKVIHESVCRMLKEEIMKKPLIDSGDKVIEYCKASMGYMGKENNRILFLNSKNYLIDAEMRSEGTIDYTHTYPREIITRALELRAKSIIMVHNHPSGDPTPSQQDIEITLHVKQLSSLMEIVLHDHIIVSKNGCYSMKINKHI
jgi:DNA repair protein RadC